MTEKGTHFVKGTRKKITLLEQKFINWQLGPNCEERNVYENNIYRYIKYFSSKETKEELFSNGKKMAVGAPFVLNQEINREEKTHTFKIIKNVQKTPESKEQPREIIKIVYGEYQNLQSVTFASQTGDVVETQYDLENQSWKSTEITAKHVGDVPKAKKKMKETAEEMYFSLEDFFTSYVPVLDNLPPELAIQLKLLTSFNEERKQKIQNRLFLGMSRADFLKTIGSLGVAALILAACARIPTFASPLQEAVAARPELQDLIDSGAIAQPIFQEVLRAEQSGLPTGAKNILYAFLSSKAGEQVVLKGWERVATPSFLYEQGIVIGSDISEIFRFKQRNGGYLFFDKKSGMYIKVAPTSSGNDANYLRMSKNYYEKGWRAAGVPEETIGRVKLTEGFTYEGKPSILLATPNMGQTLETYTAFLKANKAVNSDIILKQLLEDYYIHTLIPMNATGVYQKDPNFKNICLFEQADGTVKLVPIDLAETPMSFEKSTIFQMQYEELAKRAAGGNRGIIMPSYAEFLNEHPDIANKIGLLEGKGEIVRMHISLPGEGQKVLILVPQNMIGGAEQSAIAEQSIYNAIKQQYGTQYKNFAQGEIIPVTVSLESGEVVTLPIMKANAVGDSISAFGGKWAKFLEIGKTGLKTASDILFLMWIADEISEITDPDYVAQLDSAVAFPDSLNSLDNARTLLDNIYSTLQGNKNKLARKAADPRVWTPIMEQMFGITNFDYLRLITEGYMTQEEVGAQLAIIAEKAAFPPARSELRFQSPFPILLSGAEYPMSGMFSTYKDENNSQIILFWAQTTNSDGKIVTVPISEFIKKQGEEKWETVNLVQAPWSVEFTIDQENRVFSCSKSSSNGDNFELHCERKK